MSEWIIIDMPNDIGIMISNFLADFRGILIMISNTMLSALINPYIIFPIVMIALMKIIHEFIGYKQI